MKKFLLSLVAGIAFGFNAGAYTVSVIVPPAGATNIVPSIGGIATVTQVLLSAPTATNTSIQIIDTLTNALQYVNPAYSNTVSYLTNYVYVYTNFYGTIETYSNIVQVDLTNNLVIATTNAYPMRVNMSTLASTSTRSDSIKYTFSSGILITNNSLGNAAVTITYTK